MIWLFGLVFILHFGFHWFLKPLITLTTPIFEFHGLFILFLLFSIWTISGKEPN